MDGVAADDNPMKPIGNPPFPVERMEEIAELLE